MSRRFVYRIGPIPVKDGQVHAFFVHPPKQGAISFFGDTEQQGLQQVLSRYDAGDLESEPALFQAAAQFGILPGEITPERALIMALMTFDMALPHYFDSVEREGTVYQFGISCNRFWRAAPWRRAYAEKPVRIALAGAVIQEYESVVLGGQTEYGLTMYPQAGSVGRVSELARKGTLEEAGLIDSLGVTFQEASPFVLDAMRRAFGLTRMPVATKMTNGGAAPLKDRDMLSLAAALSAVSTISDTQKTGVATVTVGGLEVQATATAAT